MNCGVLQKAEHASDDRDVYDRPPEPLRSHPLFSGSVPVGMMSAENPRFPTSMKGGHRSLVRYLKMKGIRHQETEGHYEAPEKSVIVYGPTRDQMYHLGKRFGQEAVIWSQHGHHELLYSNGDREGSYHPSLPRVRFNPEHPPSDYWTKVPGQGYVTMYFDQDRRLPAAVSRLGKALGEGEDLEDQLRKAAEALAAPRRALPHPHAYPWHEGHTGKHQRHLGPGVLTSMSALARLRKDEFEGGKAHATNEQASQAGSSKHYGRFAAPYGRLEPGSKPSLKFYPGLEHKGPEVERLLAHHGYQAYYAGGKHGRADLANKNYDTKHLMIWDPEEGSGGDFGHRSYTDAWRKTHELAHALTHAEVNQTYGEGRRMGGLGRQRTQREAMRAVHWEHLAANKQRELLASIGVHASDQDFNREYNTVLHDAVHRAVTGKFTEPAEEGFQPHAHRVPLDVALGAVRDSAAEMGLRGEHDLLRQGRG